MLQNLDIKNVKLNLFLITLIFLLFCILQKKKNNIEKFSNISKKINIMDIKNLNPQDTIIIVGKGPNLDNFIDNISSYQKFKKIGLNNVILTNEIKFDAYMQQDFTKKVNLDYIRKTLKVNDKFNHHNFASKIYSNHLKNNDTDDLSITHKKTFNYALKNNIKIYINDIRDDYNKKLHYNHIPAYIENNPKVEITKMILSNFKNTQIGNKDNDFIIRTGTPPTVAVNCILKMISLGYQNILLSGITMMNNEDIKNKYINLVNLLKKKHPKIKFYCLYPCKLSYEVFDFYLN